MSNSALHMVEAVFDAGGDVIPASYPFALWQSLSMLVPALKTEECIGVLPLRTSESEEGRLLPKRAKLVLRVPTAIAPKLGVLSGKRLDLGGSFLTLGALKLREIQPSPTLHAHLVTGVEDEVAFVQEVAARLEALEAVGKLICGMRNSMIGPDHQLHGYSLVVHDLKPEASLRLQFAGLGAARRYGCGIFIPYKAISGID